MFTILSTILFLACSGSDSESTTSSKNRKNNVVFKAEQTGNNDFAPDTIEGISEATARISGTVLERHAKLGAEPADAIALWIEAAIRSQNGEGEGFDALGYMTIPLKDVTKWQSHGANTYFMKAIKDNNPSFRSFVVGATPENGYKVDMEDIKISIAYEGNKDVRGRKMMVDTTGSSMPRPIYVQKSSKSGLYFVKEYSSMYVDVRPAVDSNKEEFH